MLEVAHAPHQNDSRPKRLRPPKRPRGPRCAHADLLVDEGEQRGRDQAGQQQHPHHRLPDEDDVPGVPLLRERPERAHAVVVGEIEQNVAEPGKPGIEEKQSPARGQIWIFCLALAQPPNQINEADHHGGIEQYPEERVGESAMVGKAERTAVEAGENIQIGSFGGERERERGQHSLAVQPGAAHAGAGEEMGEGFQAIYNSILPRRRGHGQRAVFKEILHRHCRNALARRRQQRQRIRHD